MAGQDPVVPAAKPLGELADRLLVATPTMPDPRFARSVIYVCSHSPEGAMGIVLNRLYGDLNFRGLLTQLNINPAESTRDLPVHFGGPVEPVRGFVLHTPDYQREGTTVLGANVALTTTVEVLQAIAEGTGPSQALLALGYAGWGAGQLEEEIQANGWLVATPDPEIIFSTHNETKWERALQTLGVSPVTLLADVGHA